MKYITKGEPNIGSLPYKVDLTDDVVTIPKREATTADYVLYDKVNQELVCVASSADLSNYPSNSYTPVGIVVIPASHDVYGDGSCGIMSLKTMSCTDPQNGSADNIISENNRVGMDWGSYDTTISSLRNLTRVPIGNTSDGIPTHHVYYGYLPSDKFSDIQCAHDTDIYYSVSDDEIVSPYLTNNSRNPGYYQTSEPSSPNNALADFDGVGNTTKIITQRGVKDYSSWKPTYNSVTDYPAASCCNMFHTEGTSQGDWYLPAMGELGYIIPPFNKINKAITNILNVYSSSIGITLGANFVYWSSMEYSISFAFSVSTNNGYVHREGKGYANRVRAFLRAGGTSKISLKVI